MRHLGGFSVLACALACFACGRSHVGLGNSPGSGSGGAGTEGSGSAGVGSGGPLVMAGRPADGPPPPPPPIWPSDPPSRPEAGRGAPAMGGGSAAPPFGSSDPDPPVDPSDSNHVLNHYGCAIDEPFVLAIDPGGRSGAIRGWLESTASVWFDEHDLPRFGIQGAPDDDPDGELGLWWSIHDLDEGSVWMYGANRATEVAHVRVRRAAEIGDASTLSYAGTIGPVAVGEVAVFHHIPSDRYLAVQIGQLYQADESFERDLCTAIDARWVFAAPGTARFSRTR